MINTKNINKDKKMGLTPDQKKMINTQNFRRFIIFCAFFAATRDLLSAVTLTIIFVLFIK